MDRFTILHTNDIHGHIELLAHAASLIAAIRAAEAPQPVIYLDGGDSEEASVRLSNLTKGVVMHHLLTAAGCDAAVVGNASPLRYGYQVLADQAAAAGYPLLLANMRLPDGSPVPGVQPTAMLELAGHRLGLIGVTSEVEGMYETWFGVTMLPVVPLVRELAAALRQDGAEGIVLLSHLGLDLDRSVAAELQVDVNIIIGGHSHSLLPNGEWVGDVLIAQAGQFAGHVGRLDLGWEDGILRVIGASCLPVTEELPPSAAVLAAAEAQEAAVVPLLNQVIGELAQPLDFADDRECGVANLMADALRARMQADVSVVGAGEAFTGPLPAGPLSRLALYDVCSSSANPGVVALSGTQLQTMVSCGLDPAFAAERPRTLRGAARGLLHLSGAVVCDGQLLIDSQPVEADRLYQVAGSDWELGTLGGYVAAEWQLDPAYEVPTILREALEEYLAAHSPVVVTMGRLG